MQVKRSKHFLPSKSTLAPFGKSLGNHLQLQCLACTSSRTALTGCKAYSPQLQHCCIDVLQNIIILHMIEYEERRVLVTVGDFDWLPNLAHVDPAPLGLVKLGLKE